MTRGKKPDNRVVGVPKREDGREPSLGVRRRGFSSASPDPPDADSVDI